MSGASGENGSAGVLGVKAKEKNSSSGTEGDEREGEQVYSWSGKSGSSWPEKRMSRQKWRSVGERE
jgi:hypothetical protein